MPELHLVYQITGETDQVLKTDECEKTKISIISDQSNSSHSLEVRASLCNSIKVESFLFGDNKSWCATA